jgi:RNA polymerase sigma-70 factor (ECF subfamily)
VLQGNTGAYFHLVQRYTAHIAGLCRALVSRPDVVEDLVQETFLRGLVRLPSLRQPARFDRWLSQIARNLCRRWLRDRRHEHLSLDAVAPVLVDPESADEGDRPDRSAELKACIRRLPRRLREVLETYYAGGRVTYQEMADRLGVSFGQVNRLLTRARRALRRYLERRD